MKALSVGVMVALCVLPHCLAQEGPSCPKCGQTGCLRKVCRVVAETKKVPQIDYSCKCQDLCLPGPGKCCGTQRIADCNAPGGYRCVPIGQPSCGKIICQKKLVKQTTMVEKPVYRCVVE